MRGMREMRELYRMKLRQIIAFFSTQRYAEVNAKVRKGVSKDNSLRCKIFRRIFIENWYEGEKLITNAQCPMPNDK
jgi:hypothetical protein